MSAAADERLAGVKVPPHSIEAEQAVLGAVVLAPTAYFDIVDLLSVQDFYRGDHRLVWQHIAALVEDDQPVDVLTLGQALRASGAAGRGVDVAYVSELVEATPGVVNVRAYAEIVRDTAQLRAVIDAANRIADGAFHGEMTLADAQAHIMSLDGGRGAGGPKSMGAALSQFVDTLDRRVAGDLGGLSTGIEALDARWHGMQDGQLIVIAGRPSMGKSALGMKIAHTVAAEEREGESKVLVWSGEMSAGQIVQREVARLGRVQMGHLQAGKLTDDDWPRVTSAMSILKRSAIEYDDDAGQTIEGVCARARRLAAREGIRLLAVDYLQLLDGGGGGGDATEAERLGVISRALKRLAGELKIPVIALAQLNRGLEQRANKRPTMADIRGSGAIEQDADIILGIYRDEVYYENSTDAGLAELITLKGRDLGIGTDRVEARLEFMDFRDLSADFAPYRAPAPVDDL